jgi:hypothetical protein
MSASTLAPSWWQLQGDTARNRKQVEGLTASTSLGLSTRRWWIRMGGLARRLTRLKWHYIYFLLAGFDLLTVSAGLYLNHKIIRTYTRSVEINRVWTKEPRLTRISGNWRPPLMHRATMSSTTAGWTRNPRKCGPLRRSSIRSWPRTAMSFRPARSRRWRRLCWSTWTPSAPP